MPFRLANDAIGPTAGECVAAGWRLVVHCTCGRNERFPQQKLAAMAPETSLAEIARRLVCSGCGGSEGVVGLGNAGWHPGRS